MIYSISLIAFTLILMYLITRDASKRATKMQKQRLRLIERNKRLSRRMN